MSDTFERSPDALDAILFEKSLSDLTKSEAHRLQVAKLKELLKDAVPFEFDTKLNLVEKNGIYLIGNTGAYPDEYKSAIRAHVHCLAEGKKGYFYFFAFETIIELGGDNITYVSALAAIQARGLINLLHSRIGKE
jgi:hypothetical protein